MAGDDAKPPSALKSFISGGVGGVALVGVGHPLDTIKVRVQTMPDVYKSGMDCFKKTVASEGAKGLYKGIAAPLAGVTPMYALCFLGYGLGKTQFGVDQTMLQRMDYSDIPLVACAGITSAIFTTPILAPGERLKCVLQVQPKESAIKTTGDAARHVYRNGGITSVFRGFTATFMRDGLGSAAYFGSYEFMKAHSTPTGEAPTVATTLISGGVAGMLNWAVALPIDTLKSRLQVAPEKYPNGIRSVFTEVMRTEGAGALYRGFGPVMARAFPANAACFLGFESSMKFLTYMGID